MKNKHFFQQLKGLLFLKFKFGLSSLVATGADFSIYLLLSYTVFNPTISNIISASVGMIINFFLQKKFVFSLKRSTSSAFSLSVLSSIGGIALSTAIVHFLTKDDFLFTHKYIPKLIAIGVVFFYNFYTKKFIFEKQIKVIDKEE